MHHRTKTFDFGSNRTKRSLAKEKVKQRNLDFSKNDIRWSDGGL